MDGQDAHLGDRLARPRRLADLTQDQLSERSGVSVDVIRKLEQHRKHSARLPTLHKLAAGLGVEVTGLLGDPPALSAQPEETADLVAVRRAIMPSPVAPSPESDSAEPLSLALLRAEVAEGWTLYHAAEFGRLMRALPGIINDARMAVTVADPTSARLRTSRSARRCSSAGTSRSGWARPIWRCRVWSGDCSRPGRVMTRCSGRCCPTRCVGPTSGRIGSPMRNGSRCTPPTGSNAPVRPPRKRCGSGAAC